MPDQFVLQVSSIVSSYYPVGDYYLQAMEIDSRMGIKKPLHNEEAFFVY